jgi:hypothetical protein
LREWKYSFTHSLPSALDEGEWSASCSCSSTTREGVRGTRWIGGLVGPTDGLDAVVKRKIPSFSLFFRGLSPLMCLSSELILLVGCDSR